jgi:preprotein translocase subunit SecE
MLTEMIPDTLLDRGRQMLSAAVVVICYLIVFAGLLYSIAGAAQ